MATQQTYEEKIAAALRVEKNNELQHHKNITKRYTREKLLYDNDAEAYKKLYKEEKFLYDNDAETYNSLEGCIRQRYQINTQLRIKYSSWIFCYLCIFSLLCFTIIFFQGFHYKDFNLDTIAITTLIGGFAASVIGLVQIILRGLFLSEEKSINQQIKTSNRKEKE